MIIPTGKNLSVEIMQPKEAGTHWTVKLYKKTFISRKVITSDWFMNEQQATTFAENLAAELKGGEGLENIVSRKPGWTLHRTQQ